jgi:hypothetical protein
MNASRLIWLLALMAICVGCSRTYIGDGGGTPSPDGQLRLSVTSHGAYGRSYVDNTKKEVWISLWRADANTPIFQRSYRVVGSDVSWDTRWTSASNVVVQFFDYGDGVTSYDAPPSRPKHQIRTIRFHVDGHTGKVSQEKDAAADLGWGEWTLILTLLGIGALVVGAVFRVVYLIIRARKRKAAPPPLPPAHRTGP